MAVSLTHTTVAAGTDAGTGEIHKAQWNENHTMTMATARLLGRTTASTGAVEEISVTSPMTLTAGALGGLGTIASQNANAVAITGGTINGTTIGATSATSGVFTNISYNGTLASTSGPGGAVAGGSPAYFYRTGGAGSWPWSVAANAIVEVPNFAARVFGVVSGATGLCRWAVTDTGVVYSAGAGLDAATGSPGSEAALVVKKAGIANNTATGMITVTVPNAAHNAAIFLNILGHLGTGTDASESSRCATGSVVLARTAGVATVAAVSALAAAQIATVAGGGTLTLAYDLSAMSGATSATQTFTIRVTLVVTGTITDHTCVVAARLLNSMPSGVTIAAA